MSFEMPQADPVIGKGMIPTMNKMGWMTDQITDPYTEEFVQYALAKDKPAFEIGAAYGVASRVLIEKNKNVFINDLEKKHLDIFYSQISDDRKSNVTLFPGSCVEPLDVPPESVSAILCSRVFHFLSSEEILKSLLNFYSYLEIGGRIFVVAESIFHGLYKNHIPEFLRKKSENISTPGQSSLKKLAQNQYPEKADVLSHLSSQLPDFFNFIDIETMSILFNKAGFLVEKASYFKRNDYPDHTPTDGNEAVGLVGVKVC